MENDNQEAVLARDYIRKISITQEISIVVAGQARKTRTTRSRGIRRNSMTSTLNMEKERFFAQNEESKTW
jgi:hypothetical protein